MHKMEKVVDNYAKSGMITRCPKFAGRKTINCFGKNGDYYAGKKVYNQNHDN